MELTALGWDSFFAEAFEAQQTDGLIPARVTVEYNRFYRGYTEHGEVQLETAGRLRHFARSRSELPTVGDWVAVRPLPDGGTIQSLLPRRTQFSRKVAGRVTDEQVVAANVDSVFLVSGLDHELNLRRIERYVTLAWEGGAQPVIVLNKADLAADVESLGREVSSVAPGVPIVLVSARHALGLQQLGPYLQPGKTIALLGSSGVGKTTLMNMLLGEDRFETQAVRMTDSRGRHTTTTRQLIILPGGALLLDTPGMRELQLWEAAESAEATFADVEELAAQCRFADCRHEDEPGCAVQVAIESGALEPGRVENYWKIQTELDRLDEQRSRLSQIENKRRVKVATREYERIKRSR